MPSAPKKDESESDFVKRGMEDKSFQKEYPDQKQRLAILYSMWKRRHKSAKADGPISDNPLWDKDENLVTLAAKLLTKEEIMMAGKEFKIKII